MSSSNQIRVDVFCMKFIPNKPHFSSVELKCTTRRNLAAQLRHNAKLKRPSGNKYNPIVWLNQILRKELQNHPIGTIMVTYYWSIESGVREAFISNNILLPKLTLMLLPNEECWYGTNGIQIPQLTVNAHETRSRSRQSLPIILPNTTPTMPQSSILEVACNVFHDCRRRECPNMCAKYTVSCRPLDEQMIQTQHKRPREIELKETLLYRVKRVSARIPPSRVSLKRKMSRMHKIINPCTILEEE